MIEVKDGKRNEDKELKINEKKESRPHCYLDCSILGVVSV